MVSSNAAGLGSSVHKQDVYKRQLRHLVDGPVFRGCFIGIDRLDAIAALAHLPPAPGVGVLGSFPIGFRNARMDLVGTQGGFRHGLSLIHI